MNPLWFALHVRPRHEKTAAAALKSKGFEEFLPLYACFRRWSDRLKRVEAPLFPRYVFCRFAPRESRTVLATPGVLSVVGFGKRPIPVADQEIHALQAIVASGLPAEPWPFLQVGQLVRMDAGPLSGLEGILLDFKSGHRLIVSVTLLQRSVAVEIERLWVRPISPPVRRPARAVGRPATAGSKSA